MIRGTPKIFKYLRGEKATRGNFNFKEELKTLAETMILINLVNVLDDRFSQILIINQASEI